MGAYTVGQIRRLFYSNESSYGVTTTASMSYLGEIKRLKCNNNFNSSLEYIQGQRSFGQEVREAALAGFTYEGWVRADSTSPAFNWTTFWANYSMGSTAGTTTSELGSFSALAGKTVGANNYYDLYNGCKINRMTLSAEKLGGIIKFEADVFAQYCTKDTDLTFAGLQAVTVGTPTTSIPTSNPVCWNSNITVTAGTTITAYPTKWNLVIDNNIGREPGVRVGDDANNYQLEGYALTEGELHITLEMTVPHSNETWVNLKRAGTAITSAVLTIDNKTVTLGAGVFEPSDFPEYKQDRLEETVTMKFQSITIA